MNAFSQLSDPQLVGRLINGDAGAAEELIWRYRRPLHALLRGALGPVPEVDDAFQNIWVRVVRSASGYDPLQRFDRWLFSIAWNVVRDEWKRASGQVAPPESFDIVDRSPHAEELAERADRSRRVLSAVHELPEKMSEVILLRYFEELTENECANRLNVPLGTIKSRAHTGLKRLREILGGGRYEPAP